LFWFTSAVTCLVFTLLIYALVYTFGDVGKAAAVVVLVLQIAGSSGTYPIELLPEFFRKVYIFFPFPYAINAMRECICGMYEADYVIYLMELAIFLIPALVIGLLLRIPFEEINHYMEMRMEDTEMM
jgi:putative membrane protein